MIYFRLDICDFKMAEPSTADDGTAGKCVNDYLKFEANSDLFMVSYILDNVQIQLKIICNFASFYNGGEYQKYILGHNARHNSSLWFG